MTDKPERPEETQTRRFHTLRAVCWEDHGMSRIPLHERTLAFLMAQEEPSEAVTTKLARELAEDRFLYEYCNSRLGIVVALNTAHLRGVDIQADREAWREIFVDCVLGTTKSKVFPEAWPWEWRITQHTWMADEDQSAKILQWAGGRDDFQTIMPELPEFVKNNEARF